MLRCWPLLALLGCSHPEEAKKADPVPDLEAPWPEWAWQHWVWEDESTQQSATELVDGYLDRDIPVGAIIIDSPWETGYNTFDFDLDRFPDPQGFIDDMHDRDVRVMLWVVPAFNTDVDLWQEAADKGYLMQADADSGPDVFHWWKGDGSLLDYFNPKAVDWWHGHVDKALALGIDGWKCDGLDFQASITRYSPGAGRKIDRIEYSHAYYDDFFSYTRAALGDDRIVTARPVDNYGADLGGEGVSFAPQEINWAGWVGDQDGDFGGLQAAVRNFYWSSEGGYLAFGSDIGGYRDMDGVPNGRTKEVFLRWTQLGALNPVMENGGGGEHRPWMFDSETTRIYRDFVELHHALLPYLTQAGAVAFDEQRSLMTFLDRTTYAYLLGPDLLVVPVLEEGGTVQATFPAGDDWAYLFDVAQRHEGGSTATIEVPLDEYPVFVRVGSEVAGLSW